jgi:cbb3-type cytochrome oxidase subunit 3
MDHLMEEGNRNSAVAAAFILIFFGGGWFVMPWLMRVVGKYSTVVAFALAALFVAAFFIVFWLRGRSQRDKHGN